MNKFDTKMNKLFGPLRKNEIKRKKKKTVKKTQSRDDILRELRSEIRSLRREVRELRNRPSAGENRPDFLRDMIEREAYRNERR